LELTNLTAVTAAHRLTKRRYRPPIAARAIDRELVVVGVRAHDGVDVDHGAKVLRREAHGENQSHRVNVRKAQMRPRHGRFIHGPHNDAKKGKGVP